MRGLLERWILEGMLAGLTVRPECACAKDEGTQDDGFPPQTMRQRPEETLAQFSRRVVDGAIADKAKRDAEAKRALAGETKRPPSPVLEDEKAVGAFAVRTWALAGDLGRTYRATAVQGPEGQILGWIGDDLGRYRFRPVGDGAGWLERRISDAVGMAPSRKAAVARAVEALSFEREDAGR